MYGKIRAVDFQISVFGTLDVFGTLLNIYGGAAWQGPKYVTVYLFLSLMYETLVIRKLSIKSKPSHILYWKQCLKSWKENALSQTSFK